MLLHLYVYVSVTFKFFPSISQFELTFFFIIECNSITYSKVIYIQHMKTHGNKKLKCNVCSEEYNHARSFNQHLQSHNIGILNCIFCNYNSSSYVKMVHHLLQKHSSEPMYISARHKAVS